MTHIVIIKWKHGRFLGAIDQMRELDKAQAKRIANIYEAHGEVDEVEVRKEKINKTSGGES